MWRRCGWLRGFVDFITRIFTGMKLNANTEQIEGKLYFNIRGNFSLKFGWARSLIKHVYTIIILLFKAFSSFLSFCLLFQKKHLSYVISNAFTFMYCLVQGVHKIRLYFFSGTTYSISNDGFSLWHSLIPYWCNPGQWGYLLNHTIQLFHNTKRRVISIFYTFRKILAVFPVTDLHT